MGNDHQLRRRCALLAATSVVCIAAAGGAFAQTPVGTPPSAPMPAMDPNGQPPAAGIAQGPASEQAASPSQTQGEQATLPTTPDDAGAGAQAIVVTGIRGAQQAAVNIKRNAVSVVDSISATDIGKLPDRTIADSLQRIPGVQIRRDAGEGAQINIRGLPQVTTLLNGEAFIGAQSITTIQPNLNDIPSQLFAGADVIKSSTADLLNAGITGTVNLRTRRPFDLKSGVTAALAAEGTYGEKAKKGDPSINGLLSWHNDRFGFLVSAAYSNNHLSNSHNGIQEGYGAALHNEGTADVTSTQGFSPAIRPHGTAVAGGRDVNGDGDSTDAFIVPQGFTGWNRINERQRLGINASAQWHINDALELTGDAFYTRLHEYDRTAGFQMQDVNWQAAEFVPGQSRNTGASVVGSDGRTYDINTTQIYNYDLGNFDAYSQTDRYRASSQNYNLELKYDDGGRFKASLRGLYGKAHNNYSTSYGQFSLSNGQQWEPGGIGHYPTGNLAFNTGGYTVNTLAGSGSLPATVNYTGSMPSFTLPSQLLNELGDPSNYALKTLSSEGNYRRKSDQKIIRGDASYEVNDALSFAFGGRYSDRSTSDYEFDRAAPLYAGAASQPGGCLVKWKGFDVPLNDASCSAGDASGFYTAGLTRKANDPALSGIVKTISVPANGVPALTVIDPKAMDNALKFQNSFYPGNVEVQNPGASFDVGVKQISGYVQMNFKGDLFGLPFAGNAGVKIINTRLDITQYVTGSPQPYGLANLPNGSVNTKRSFTDYLPAFNVAFNVTNDLKLRLAFTKTMTLLDLAQWGGGLTPNYAIDTSGPSPVFRVTGGNSNGNPQLEPWRATNADVSLEYYIGRASLLSLGGFYIDVDSFIQQGNITRTDLPDNDGVVRGRTVSITTPVQGQGGTLKGLEGGARLSFGDLHFAPNFIRNFGIDANITFSPSSSGQKDLAGKSIPFQDNSKLQSNIALFYQDRHLQARVAWNYRSKRAAQSDFGGIKGLELYQSATNYIDASISYDLNDHFTIYAQGSNLGGEYEKYYLTWTDQRAYNNIYERRYTGGARIKF